MMGFKINFLGIIEWAQIQNFKQLCVQMSTHILLVCLLFFFFCYLLSALTENDF